MIFHYPDVFDPERYPAASQIRPVMLVKAFRSLNYDVDVVMGTIPERSRQIDVIVRKIRAGGQYEFLYSDGLDSPTLLTTRSRLPLHPWVDYRLFTTAKNAGIPLGVFYRDIRWRFPEYWTHLGLAKGFYGYVFFLVDLWIYKRCFDAVFLPSVRMLEYFPRWYRPRGVALPAGCASQSLPCSRYRGGVLHVLYVGGVDESVYDLRNLSTAIRRLPVCRLSICCRRSDWDISVLKKQLDQYPADNIKVVHLSGDALGTYYSEAHILGLTLGSHRYHEFAMPFKLFEYIAHQGPILCTAGTAVAQFVENKGAGIIVEDSSDAIERSLQEIVAMPAVLAPIYENLKTLPSSESWERRALLVGDTLTNSRK